MHQFPKLQTTLLLAEYLKINKYDVVNESEFNFIFNFQ